jgi:hypothetical protein
MHQQAMDATYAHGAAFRTAIIGPANGRAIPLMGQLWDDHDYGWNNSDTNMERKSSALAAHRNYYPQCDEPAADGIYTRCVWGQAEWWLLDVRSYRSPYTAIDDAGKTMLGATQLAWLEDGLVESTAVWKIIVTPSAWNPTTDKGDSWATYQTEANGLLYDLVGVPGIVLVSGDLHSVGLIDNGSNAGWPELNVPPTNTSGPGCTDIPSGCGTWSESWSETWVAPGYVPHAGLGVLSFTPESLTLIVVGNDGTERRSLTLVAP